LNKTTKETIKEIRKEWKEYREDLERINSDIDYEWIGTYINMNHVEQVESLLRKIENNGENLLRMYDENYRLTESIQDIVNYKNEQIEYFSASNKRWQQECGKLLRKVKELESRLQEKDDKTWDERL